MVALVGCTKNRYGSIPIAICSGFSQLPQGKHLRRAPQNGSSLCFLYKSMLESVSGYPDILDPEDLDFLAKNVRDQTRGSYGSGWHRFLRFYKGKNVIPWMALLPFFVTFIYHMFKSRVSHAVMAAAIAAIRKYHILDQDSGLNLRRHPLVSSAKKSFLQLRPRLSKYHGTYEMKIVVRLIEKL